MEILRWLCALAAIVGVVTGSCQSSCSQTNFRGYSNCLQNSCNTASNCMCNTVSCNTCQQSDQCCQSCCQNTNNFCNCQNVQCGSCQSGGHQCCSSCCQSQQVQSCQSSSCSAPAPRCESGSTSCNTPVTVHNNFTMPNIQITINKHPIKVTTGPVINNISRTCGYPGGPTCRRPEEHTIYAPPRVIQPPPIVRPPQVIDSPPIYRPPQVIQPPPIVRPPQVIDSPPIYRPPQVIQSPPIYRPPQVIQSPPIYRPPQVIQSPPIVRPPQVIQSPPIIHPPQVIQSPPIVRPPQIIQSPPIIQPGPIIQQPSPCPITTGCPTPVVAPVVQPANQPLCSVNGCVLVGGGYGQYGGGYGQYGGGISYPQYQGGILQTGTVGTGLNYQPSLGYENTFNYGTVGGLTQGILPQVSTTGLEATYQAWPGYAGAASYPQWPGYLQGQTIGAAPNYFGSGGGIIVSTLPGAALAGTTDTASTDGVITAGATNLVDGTAPVMQRDQPSPTSGSRSTVGGVRKVNSSPSTGTEGKPSSSKG